MTIQVLVDEDDFKALQAKCTAQASLIKSFDESKGTYKAMYSECATNLRQAAYKAATVDSERVMNAELTEENARLRAALEHEKFVNQSMLKDFSEAMAEWRKEIEKNALKEPK